MDTSSQSMKLVEVMVVNGPKVCCQVSWLRWRSESEGGWKGSCGPCASPNPKNVHEQAIWECHFQWPSRWRRNSMKGHCCPYPCRGVQSGRPGTSEGHSCQVSIPQVCADGRCGGSASAACQAQTRQALPVKPRHQRQ